jgi:Na+/proline symporter
MDSRQEIKWSKIFTLLWGIVLIGSAMLFKDANHKVVETALKIASVTYGGLLGTFFLGLLSTRYRERDAFIGISFGLAAMVYVSYQTKIDFTWHTFIGCVVTIAAGYASSLIFSPKAPNLKSEV